MDSRRIKRLSDSDHFTVDPLSALKNPDNVICDNCAKIKCKIRNYVTRQSDNTQLRVMTCADFIPALGFSVLGGLDHDTWNTIRVGGAWADRLKPGKIVSVIDTKNLRRLGEYEVTRTHTGTLEDMVRAHARYNHAIQHEIIIGKTRAEDEAIFDRMMRILKNANGTNIASPDRAASVVYLRKQ